MGCRLFSLRIIRIPTYVMMRDEDTLVYSDVITRWYVAAEPKMLDDDWWLSATRDPENGKPFQNAGGTFREIPTITWRKPKLAFYHWVSCGVRTCCITITMAGILDGFENFSVGIVFHCAMIGYPCAKIETDSNHGY